MYVVHIAVPCLILFCFDKNVSLLITFITIIFRSLSADMCLFPLFQFYVIETIDWLSMRFVCIFICCSPSSFGVFLFYLLSPLLQPPYYNRHCRRYHQHQFHYFAFKPRVNVTIVCLHMHPKTFDVNSFVIEPCACLLSTIKAQAFNMCVNTTYILTPST